MLTLLALMAVAPAATFNVNTTLDIAGVCGLSCSLRQAVGSANANPGPDTIQLMVGTYNLTLVGAGEDANATGDLDITGPTTILGPVGPGVRVIDGGWNDRIFHVTTGAALTVRRVMLRNGSESNRGGGILANGDLTLTDVRMGSNRDLGARPYNDSTGGAAWVAGDLWAVNSTFEGNRATHGRGGAVWVGGDATVAGCTFDENSVWWGGQGGALFVTGAATISDSTFETNDATALPSGTGLPLPVGGGQGGALFTAGSAALQGVDLRYNGGTEGGAWYALGASTFSGGDVSYNDASVDGGGVFLFGDLVMDLATVTNNTSASAGTWAFTGGGGIFGWYSSVELIDTTLDANIATGGRGGGLAILSGDADVTGSTLSANGADSGAAVYVQGSLAAVNSTFSGNVSEDPAGIVALWPSGGLPVTADFVNCTFGFNETDAAGTPDALSLDPTGGAITVENTLILDGCLAALTSADHNLETGNTCGLTGANDLPSTPMVVGVLFNNGGPTKTHQIGPATAARGAARYATCIGADVGGVDQRGVSRLSPLSVCDIGAYEY
ncbi:MAG TPA: CSLREA domain-containing protein [Myxococcota bacterium]|nr:CSLREA domain-containing protein [Myxococcota bacterium]